MSGFQYEKDCDNIVTITMDMPNQPVNTMSDAFHVYLKETMDALEQDDFAGVILTSGKETFFAGGDLKGMLSYTPALEEERFARSMAMKTRLRRLETLGKPVVAAINGAALGGGYEICLCTHHRIAMKTPKSLIGLPEVTLGLLPGGGGVVRLTRLLGFKKALPLLMEGTRLSPEKAFAAGLVDELCEDRIQLLAKAKAWIKANPAARQPWDADGFEIPGGGPSQPKVRKLIAMTSTALQKKTHGFYPAPETILAIAVEAAQVNFETALRIESHNFLKLLSTPVAQNLITNFFQTNMVKSGASRPQGFEKFKVRKIGILGSSKMGGDIAYAAAKVGIEVILKYTSPENAEQGKRDLNTLLDNLLVKGLIREGEKATLLSKITATSEAKEMGGCKLIIDTVTDDTHLKARAIREAEALLGGDGILATQTSILPITGLAETTKDSARFVGLNFVSLGDDTPLVEIICSPKTSHQTLACVFDFVQQVKKTPIVVNDSQGFYISRVFDAFIDEGCALRLEGVEPLVIDRQAMLAGMQVGPLAAQDEMSQKLSNEMKSASQALSEIEGGELAEPNGNVEFRIITTKYKRLSEAYFGSLYRCPENASKQVIPMPQELSAQPNVQIKADEIRDRLLFRQVIEAVRCLDAGVLSTVAECNVGSILGIGFPPHTGGHLQYINSYGIKKFVVRARELAQKYGERFEPPELLLEKAKNGETFT